MFDRSFFSRLCCPWHRRGAVPPKSIAVVAGSLVLVAVLGYWILSPSTEDLLDLETLTPKQVRTVANKLLLHDDLKIRMRASGKLTSVGQPAVPVLKEICLTGSDNRLRNAVLGIVITIDTNAAIEIVEEMYNDSDPGERGLALVGAQQINDPRAEAIMIKALDDPNEGIRSSVAGKLGSKGAKDAAPKLKKALDDPNPRVRRHAARSLRTLTGVDYSDRVKNPKK